MSEIRVVGVVGAGQMGRGIAQVAAAAGYKVVLSDSTRELAEAGHKQMADGLAKLVAKGKLTEEKRSEISAAVSTGQGVECHHLADILIEAVTESFDVKAAIFREADRVLPDKTILATNTSSISITKLAAVTSRPDRVVGMHFMNPVPVMKLVELARGLATSDATFEATRDLALKMGKTLITSKDSPGFIVNRMLIPFLNEACFVLQEGISSAEDIDQGAKLGLAHPMGPLELADLIGLDTTLAIAEVLHRELGDSKYRPATLLKNMVTAGWLGKKTKRGFYVYDEKGQKK